MPTKMREYANLLRRDFLKGMSASAAVLPFLSAEIAPAQSSADPYLAYVHPELRAMAAQMLPLTANQTPPSLSTLNEQRPRLMLFLRDQ
jgi:hypothetical protein